MKILIVHAHPEPRSFCAALKDTAVAYFEKNGNEVLVSDLYQMGFDPVGGEHDFTERKDVDYFKYQAEQLNAYQEDLFSPELKVEMDKVHASDVIIFNFPLWWFGLPAMLKGWVDRVFAMGFIYGAGKGVYDNGPYPDKKAFVTMTTGGSQPAYGNQGKNGKFDTILFPFSTACFTLLG